VTFHTGLRAANFSKLSHAVINIKSEFSSNNLRLHDLKNQASKFTISSNFQTWLVIPASIAGVTRKV